MSRSTPRYIEPACIDNGDIIRVVWKAGGIEHSRTARVYRCIDEGGVYAFFTEEGTEIMHWMPGNPRNAKVVLIERAAVQPHSELDIFLENMSDEAKLAAKLHRSSTYGKVASG